MKHNEILILQMLVYALNGTIQASHFSGKNPSGLPKPWDDTDKEIENAHYHEAVFQHDCGGMGHVTAEGIAVLIKRGFKTRAERWSFNYDDLMFYAQQGIMLPPLQEFTKKQRDHIRRCWLRAQKIGAHIIDRQGIQFLLHNHLPVGAAQWPISNDDMLFFAKHKIVIPHFDDFIFHRAQKLREILRTLGTKAPKMAQPKTDTPIFTKTSQPLPMISSAPAPKQSTAPEKPLMASASVQPTAPLLTPVYLAQPSASAPSPSPLSAPSSTSSLFATPTQASMADQATDDDVGYVDHEDNESYLAENFEEYDLGLDGSDYEGYSLAEYYEPAYENTANTTASVQPAISSPAAALLVIEPTGPANLPANGISQRTHENLLISEPYSTSTTSTTGSINLLDMPFSPANTRHKAHEDLLISEPYSTSTTSTTNSVSLLDITSIAPPISFVHSSFRQPLMPMPLEIPEEQGITSQAQAETTPKLDHDLWDQFAALTTPAAIEIDMSDLKGVLTNTALSPYDTPPKTPHAQENKADQDLMNQFLRLTALPTETKSTVKASSATLSDEEYMKDMERRFKALLSDKPEKVPHEQEKKPAKKAVLEQ